MQPMASWRVGHNWVTEYALIVHLCLLWSFVYMRYKLYWHPRPWGPSPVCGDLGAWLPGTFSRGCTCSPKKAQPLFLESDCSSVQPALPLPCCKSGVPGLAGSGSWGAAQPNSSALGASVPRAHSCHHSQPHASDPDTPPPCSEPVPPPQQLVMPCTSGCPQACTASCSPPRAPVRAFLHLAA